MPYILKQDREKFQYAKMIGVNCDGVEKLAEAIYLACCGFNSPVLKLTDPAFKMGELCVSNGELNYLITNICLGFLGQQGLISYQKIDDIFQALEIVIYKCEKYGRNKCLGTLRCAELEFYRKVAENYENLKASENGEVF